MLILKIALSLMLFGLFLLLSDIMRYVLFDRVNDRVSRTLLAVGVISIVLAGITTVIFASVKIYSL